VLRAMLQEPADDDRTFGSQLQTLSRRLPGSHLSAIG
jgi:hypothetical protein